MFNSSREGQFEGLWVMVQTSLSDQSISALTLKNNARSTTSEPTVHMYTICRANQEFPTGMYRILK